MSRKKVSFQNGKTLSFINYQQLKGFYKDLWGKIVPVTILNASLILITTKIIPIETLYRHQTIFNKFRIFNRIHCIFYKRNFNKLWVKSTIHSWKSILLFWENRLLSCLKINSFQNLSHPPKLKLLNKVVCKIHKITLLPTEYCGFSISFSLLSSKNQVFIYFMTRLYSWISGKA